MRTTRSQRWRVSRESPWPSDPSTSAYRLGAANIAEVVEEGALGDHVQPDDPNPHLVKPRERVGDATDERHRQVLDGPGCGLCDRRGHVHRSVPWQHDARRSGA